MVKERRRAVNKYAVYTSSRIYHLMMDEKRTKCGVNVFASDYQGDWAVAKIVESIPEGLRLCQHCSDESSKKKGVGK